MMNEQEWRDFFLQEEQKLGVGSPQFFARHEEIIDLIEEVKEKNRTTKNERGEHHVF